MLLVRNEDDFVPWFTALPSKILKTYILPNQFRVAIKFQFGIETSPSGSEERKCEACGKHMDPLGVMAQNATRWEDA